jgi:hypothetical protein
VLVEIVAGVALAAEPAEPSPIEPADGATGIALDPTLEVAVEDPDGDPLDVVLQGRVRTEPGPDFAIVAIPDTQNYACACNGGQPSTFLAQAQWIADHAAELGVAFVTHLGDCTENADSIPEEWDRADDAMSLVEDAGLPFGITVGNHDQTPFGDPAGTTEYFNATFGEARFRGRDWYGGHYGSDNDNHVELFDAGGTGWVIVHLEYDPFAIPAVIDWVDEVLTTHADRRAIVVTHWLIDAVGSPSPQAAQYLDRLTAHENLVLMLGGHIPGEGRRSERIGGRDVHLLLSNYQTRANGGDGWLRILRFSPAAGILSVETYSPTKDEYEEDEDSQFTLALDLSPLGWEEVGTGTSATWPGRAPATEYEWRALVSDAETTTYGPRWTFTTEDAAPIDTGSDSALDLDSGPSSGDSAPTDTSTPAVASEEPIVVQGGCGCAGAGSGAGAAVFLGAAALCLRPPASRRR